MPLSLGQTKTALAPRLTASFAASGGTEPYTYSVLPDGAGGTIDASSGLYTAPVTASSNPRLLYDTIQVTDDDGATTTAQIMVAGPLLLFCEIMQRELGLANGRAYLWDQKILQPTDSGLYVAVSLANAKPFGNSTSQGASGWNESVQSVNMLAQLNLDICSRGPEARDRKEEVILALNSIYAQKQQEGNSFYIGKLSPSAGFINLSMIDGAAIPYRYRISVNIQYAVTKTGAVDYFDEFEEPVIIPNS